MSLVSSQADVQNQAVVSTEPADTTITKSKLSTIPTDTSPGSYAPIMLPILYKPYHPTKSANTPSQSTDRAGKLPNHGSD